MTILDEIFAHKRTEVAQRREAVSLETVQADARLVAPPLDFVAALRGSPSQPALIAEVKHLSPSRGLLAAYFDPIQLARIYAENGAAAISVLTDERYFGGDLEDLRQIARRTPRLPLLRKDFIYDPYQVYEARAAGADAILLVATALSKGQLCDLHDLACSLGMTPLVEIHTAQDLDVALTCHPLLVGINNRDLRDFSVNLETTFQLRPLIPPGICVVAESGIFTRAAAQVMADIEVDAILVGEALVTAGDVAAQVRLLTRSQREG